MSIKIKQSSLALIKQLVSENRMKEDYGGTKYQLLDTINEEPIPKSITKEVKTSPNGKPYPYGTFLRINTDEKILRGDHIFRNDAARAAYKKLDNEDGVNLSIYSATEDFTASNGKAIKKGDCVYRVNIAD